MTKYYMVHFYDEFFGVGCKADKHSGLSYVEPKYKNYIFRKREVVGMKYTWSVPEYVKEHCFLSREEASTLCKLLNDRSDAYDKLTHAVENPTVIDNCGDAVSANSGST